MAQILQETYENKLEIIGHKISKEKLQKQENDIEIEDNNIFIDGINDLEKYIIDADIWWDAVNISRQIRSIVSFMAQKTCYLTNQDIKIVAVDLKVPFNIILERYKNDKNPTYSLSQLENMLERKILEPVDLTSENIDEYFGMELRENNQWELTKWDISDKCQFIDANDSKIALFNERD